VREEINELKSKQRTYSDAINGKLKEYEYLQFLWGTRQKSPSKVEQVDVGWMLGFRIVLMVVLGILGVGVHVLGRVEPLSIIIVFLMIRSWEFVWLRFERFLMTWLTVAAILLDIVWIALCSFDVNQINFMRVDVCIVVSYVLLGVKIVLLGYLVVVESSLSSK
jgi:hypothetical protein